MFADELTDSQIDQALSLGVKGFFSRTESLSSIATAIRQVGEGHGCVESA